MSSKERRTVPAEAVEIYTQFAHGEISRRSFLDGVKKLAVAGLSAGAIVEALLPDYAMGQQISRDDERITTSYETLSSPDGNGFIRGYLVRPFSADSRSETPSQLPGIIVVHENRGLNPHTEDVARRLALANFMAFAPDVLTSVGGYPGDDYQGGQLFRQIDNDRKFEDIVASALWLKNRSDCTGKIGVTGFCYGGSVSNQLAVRLGEDLAAAVPFYGGGADAADVPNIRAAILVQHGELDTRLVNAWPAYEEALIANNVTHEGHIYPGAVRGFFNDATPERYLEAAATEAWTRTIDWFNRYVRE
ncbi:MAG TPA: carboxymethylenebutenolidase [Gammaproteobacteria bacterium]|jgi:carboxymethylenebutenolidase|nr:dienelactone hydrolase family protein [Gammaproteobacteria bacterium]MDP6731499.1 dienelactone hydrolase family protein [Gammaproteobacteria bacterium]HAJ76401.1 carboxymethylenebutenolidase [Gammaproteobacteria bacterium]|tara:strand:+ start:2615 stop:3529 length:915 start_codon:yes stop_codon:yes gene_type:complete